MPWTFIKFCEIVFPTFIYFHKSYRNSANIRQHLTVFPSYFNNIYLKYIRILQNLMRNYEILLKFTKSWHKLRYSTLFFGQITFFHSVSFNYDVLLAFCNFIPWRTKFFCLLSYCFASRQHRQICRHRQMKGDISSIADTYSKFDKVLYPPPNYLFYFLFRDFAEFCIFRHFFLHFLKVWFVSKKISTLLKTESISIAADKLAQTWGQSCQTFLQPRIMVIS